MDFSYSPGHSPETLQLSPTHFHDMNPLLELRNLRRSMSRSPSRFARPSTRSPLNSPPGSAPRSPLRHPLVSMASTQPMRSSSLSDDSAPQSARKTRSSRPALSRATPIRGLFKTAQAQAQAQQPASSDQYRLADSSDFGNSSPAQSPLESGLGQENASRTPLGSPKDTFEEALRAKSTTMPIRTPTTRARTPAAIDKDLLPPHDWAPAKSSPLKRSDGSVNSRNPDIESPSAKRRSLNGAPFDNTRDLDDVRHLNHDQLAAGDDISSDEAAFRASLPPSAFHGFRKSLLQSKVSSKSPATRNRRSLESGTNTSSPKRVTTRPRPRTSLDSVSITREASGESDRTIFDFSSPEFARPTHALRSTRQQPHPLSQALSSNSPSATQTGSKTSGLDSPADAERPAAFSKSLPIGALRPKESSFVQGAENSSFATPRAFNDVRPNPAAFRSTGLISKRHRNIDDMPAPPNARGMPDTPCKRTHVPIGMNSSPGSVASVVKPRFGQPSFGTPSRPSGLQLARPGPSAFSKSVGFFDRDNPRPTFDRRASFASVDSEELLQSPTRARDSQPGSQSSADDLPPTPTKTQSQSQFTASKSSSLRSSIFGRRPHVAVDTFVAPDNSQNMPFATSTATDKLNPQTPITDNSMPDPSFLSISPSCKTPRSPDFRNTFRTSVNRPPATPSHRESTDSISGIVATPSHQASNQDADPVLSERFKRAEWYARGEFSDVFKVYQSGPAYFSPSRSGKPQPTPTPDRVYMVKKSRTVWTSIKSREKQLREPQIMQALGRSDHVVFLMDYWDFDNRLYMQMEFCEEGTLSTFLAKQGTFGRLDDFRIWKILIELTLGVKHIHDSGFMHLDLKPENVFIDFEGTLKIGDFGLASVWPAPVDIEGEGDRRYMGPDLLVGAFDKPADIFALGMIMYETAANFIPPDNGNWWQKLRSGDFSDLPSLTSAESLAEDAPSYLRISSNLDADQSRSSESLFSPASGTFESHASIDTRMTSWDGSSNDKLHLLDTDLASPPDFMMEPEHPESLDKVVHWMMKPEPAERPNVDQVLEVAGCQWVRSRRRSGAIIFEGRWGPADHMLPPAATGEDSIMTDV